MPPKSSKSNDEPAPEGMTKVSFRGIIGNPASEHSTDRSVFAYIINFPSDLCRAPANGSQRFSPEESKAITNYLRPLQRQLSLDHFARQTWACIGCGEAAHLLDHHTVLGLYNFNNDDKWIGPNVLDYQVPLCSVDKEECVKKGVDIVADKLKETNIDIKDCVNAAGRCVVCGIEEGTKRCTGCKHVSYCSRDCQKSDWMFHKLACKPVVKAK
ncbi:hypothetical protein BJ508DRAFT_362446 [Ascobolus immersus RN42]|uniref:MYND-type domain-containing protein n=1 Tax=Ascobolus immersus RN42 TaxID=1160509 RepID=A0A3N4IGK4_ASCIM|nr:hypothetical protein BJ508DRAFT_362446 [Ascobolus immersus RN42]